MRRHANLIEKAVQALDDGCHLLRQIAGVHDVFSCCQQRVDGSVDHPSGELRARNVDVDMSVVVKAGLSEPNRKATTR